MASALVEVNSASLGGWTTTEDGIDVLGGETVSVRLVDSAGIRLWELDIISSDELVAAPAITQAPSVSGTATFTAPASPAGGWVLIVRSQVGVHALGHDLRNQPQDDYVATFGVHLPTAESLRLVAENETYEGSSEFGWMPKINELIRRAPATGTGVSTGRTLFGTSPVRIDGGASGDLSANRTISLVPGTVSGQVLGWNGSAWVARQVVVLTDLTLDGFATGVLHSTAGVISSSLIVNADVHASAAIAVSKLAPGTNGQALVTSGGVPTWGTPTAGSVTPGTARQIYFTNATPLAEWITASGDISVPTTAGVFRVDRINGTAVTTAGGGAVGSVLRMTGSATSDWGELDLADEDAVTGLLAVTHIAPGTNGQFLSTAGGVATWALVTTTSIAPGAANTVLTTNGAGNATVWATIVNANVDAAAGIEVTKLDPGAVNTILVTNASGDIEWVAGVPGAGTLAGDVTGPLGTNVVERVHGATVPIAGALTPGHVLQVSGASALTYAALATGSIAPGTNGQVLVTAGGVAAWATPAGDWSGAVTANVVGRINGATVPAAGALTTGNGLYVSGASALTYSALNLGGGSGWVTGALPLANIAQGGAATNDVLRWNGSVWDPEPLVNILPPGSYLPQNVADIAAMQALVVTAFADGMSCWVRTLDREFRLKTTGQTPSADNDTYASSDPARIWMGAA